MLDDIARRAMQSHVKASLKKIPKRVATQVTPDNYLPNPVNFAAEGVKRKMVLGKRTLPITDRIIELKEIDNSLKNRYRETLRQYYNDHGGSLKGHQSDPNVGTLKVAGQEIRGKINVSKGVRDVKLKNKQKDIEEQARRRFAEEAQTVNPKHKFTGGHHRFELSLGAAITDGLEENQLKPFWKLVQNSYPNLFPGNHPYNQIPFERGFTDKLHKEVHRRLNIAGLDPKRVIKELAGKTAGQKFAFMEKVSKVLEDIDDFMAREMRKNRSKSKSK
tara:strand:- start:44 stop:868 length:825 start_codon:yes stop_codon:yes gene_type:complete